MPSPSVTRPSRYHALAIAMHWLMVLGLLFMFASGLYMVYGDMPKSEQYKLFQIHKASGVLMLWAIVVRILIKSLLKAPLPHASLSESNAKKAKLGHLLLYTGLVIMPLSGWLMVSASPFGLPTFVFVDWIEWPHVPGVARNKTVESFANNIHWISALVLGILVLGHISAVIIHKQKHKIDLISRMWFKRNFKRNTNAKN